MPIERDESHTTGTPQRSYATAVPRARRLGTLLTEGPISRRTTDTGGHGSSSDLMDVVDDVPPDLGQ
jgi:hypothetical protein